MFVWRRHPQLRPLTPYASPRSGAGYTFGAQVVKKFLDVNSMVHILRAHQLCMEGFSVLYDDRLSTVWSAPNYCYRCGNMASILEVGPNGEKHFNVFDAAPENERDGPGQQVPAQGPSNVSLLLVAEGSVCACGCEC